jgi:hypothetical protein
MTKKLPIQKGVKESSTRTRIRVTQEELDLINNCRKLHNEAIDKGIDPDSVKHAWFKDKNSSFFVKNPNFNTREKNDFRETLIEDLRKYSPKFTKLKRSKLKDSQLLVIDLADLHIGKLADSFETGKEYNSQIAVNRALEGVKGILNKASGVNIDKILFVGGNDILHTDTPRRTTTGGTPQDTDGMWYRNFLMAKDLYVEILEILIGVADVHFAFNPSNHDYVNGFFLANVIETYFRNCNNITFDCDISHRKYFRYYNNIIGTTHGDGAKQDNLPLLMATETPHYSECKKRYIYTHHLHLKRYADFPGITIEVLRSPSEADSWHHKNGYQHAPVAIEAFLHHKQHGQETRITHHF